MKRYLIFRSASSPQFLCVCSARDKNHALKIARNMFISLDRRAIAVAEKAA
jgi:hypothetical protein